MNVGAPEISGAFPRLLGRHVRENGDLSLMDALRKITILPARRYGLDEVGAIGEGKAADIVIFDADRIRDNADFVDRGRPDAPPDGISYVLVNGKVVVRDGRLTDNRNSGKLLMRWD
jgi:N-acyl-D-amino-acid deacylase